MKKKLGATLFAAAAVGTMLVAPPANAVTEHCTIADGQTKVEVNAGPDLYIGGTATEACIKTGTKAYIVPVVNGWISSTVYNTGRGNGRLGISYYVVTAYGDPES